MKESEITKKELYEIITSTDIESIRSLKDKELVRNLEFSDEEKIDLIQELNIPLLEIIDEPDDFHGYNFKPIYYHIFRDEYVKALLTLVGEDFEGFEYHYMWIWNLNKYSMPILRAKMRGTLSELVFTDNMEFCLFLSTIGAYFGSNEVLNFLSATDHFHIFYEMVPCDNESVAYPLETTLIQVCLAIVDHIKSFNEKDQDAAIKLHKDFLDLLTYYFTHKSRSSIAEIIYFVLRYLKDKKQLFLVSPVIKSLPQEILDEFLDRSKFLNLTEIITSVLKKDK